MTQHLEKVTIIRHFKDTDNLVRHGTDNPLQSGQESIAQEIGKRLQLDALEEGYQGILLISSPKVRVRETVKMIQTAMINDEHDHFRVRTIVNPNLRELDQGKLNLPTYYQPGAYFRPLKEAWKAFWEESFGFHHNLSYKFGSQTDNSSNQTFSQYFKETGECYKEQAIRLYTAALEFGKMLNRFQRIKPVVVTHGAPFAIYRELEIIAKDVQESKIQIPAGGLVQLSWDYFQKRSNDIHPDFGQTDTISLNSLYDNEIVSILNREINYLNNL